MTIHTVHALENPTWENACPMQLSDSFDGNIEKRLDDHAPFGQSTGAKVYIRSDATSYEELSSKGFIIFDTQLLRAMDFQDFIKMEESNKIVNHNLIYALCSSDVMAKKWEQAFDLILN